MLDDAGYQTRATSPFSIDLGTWAFVCGVKQGQTYQIYVNGILQSSFTDPHVTDGSPFNMYFMRHGAWNKYANGVLDDVRITIVPYPLLRWINFIRLRPRPLAKRSAAGRTSSQSIL